MSEILTSDNLEAYVSFIDNECGGNVRNPKVTQRYKPRTLEFKTPVDQSLDPFSQEYYDAQIALYQEIAGKPLDQQTGELHPVSIDSLLRTANPLGINNADHIAENVRAIALMCSLTNLGTNAPILDLGAGHGLSSEVYAFCGCDVHSIDIDPALSELSEKRAAARHLKIKRSVMNFDSLEQIPNNFYSAAFFFQSLHHCITPWKLIAELKTKITENGYIAFTGEPIQTTWWKHWGLRLDPESLYVARKYGWFESGWSDQFITECFRRNGMKLCLITGGHGGGVIGIASRSEESINKSIEKAALNGNGLFGKSELNISIGNYRSQIGSIQNENPVRPVIRSHEKNNGGYICYGPYASLPAGQYRISFICRHISTEATDKSKHSIVFDVISDGGKVQHHSQVIELTEYDSLRLINVIVNIPNPTTLFETRVFATAPNEVWEISLPLIEKIEKNNM